MRTHGDGFAESLKTLRARFGWSREEAARLLGASLATVSRWERRTVTPTPAATAAVERLETLASRIDTAIKPANFTRFLLTPNPALRGYPPLELLHSAYSFEDLLDFVESAQSGDMI